MEPKERPEADEIDVRAALGVSFEIYRRYFWKLMLLALILVVSVEVMYLQQIDSDGLGLVVEIIAFVTLTWFWAASVMTVKPTAKTGGYSLSDLIAAVWPKLFWLVMLTAVTDVGIFFGFGLLIAPGLFLSVIWLVVVPVMLFEGPGVFQSMSRSMELTEGHRMKLLWIAIIIWLPQLVEAGLGFLFPANESTLAAIGFTAAESLLYPFLAILTAVTYYGLIAFSGEGGSGAEVDQLEADVGTFDDRASHRLEG